MAIKFGSQSNAYDTYGTYGVVNTTTSATENDILILFGNVLSAGEKIFYPDGFSKIVMVTPNKNTFFCAYKVVTSSEPTSYQVYWESDVAWSLCLLSFSDVDLATPYGDWQFIKGTTPFATPTLTTSFGTSVIVAAAGMDTDAPPVIGAIIDNLDNYTFNLLEQCGDASNRTPPIQPAYSDPSWDAYNECAAYVTQEESLNGGLMAIELNFGAPAFTFTPINVINLSVV